LQLAEQIRREHGEQLEQDMQRSEASAYYGDEMRGSTAASRVERSQSAGLHSMLNQAFAPPRRQRMWYFVLVLWSTL
jgi:hypothetical protein